MTTPANLPVWLRRLAGAWLCLLAACGSFEEKRIREMLHEKGFGTRAQGNATIEDYVGGLDRIQFLLPPGVFANAGMERLVELAVPQPVSLDGTIFVPYVGPVYVLGKTEVELAALVRNQLRAYFNKEIDLQARIVLSNKFFYAVGETVRKGRIEMEPDLTLVDALMKVNWSPLANLGRVYLIRPDAENPLVVDVNFREILTSGYTTANFRIRERDILYVPPTFLGLVARLLQRLLEPVAAAVRTMLGAAQIRQSYDILTGDVNAGGFFFRF